MGTCSRDNVHQHPAIAIANKIKTDRMVNFLPAQVSKFLVDSLKSHIEWCVKLQEQRTRLRVEFEEGFEVLHTRPVSEGKVFTMIEKRI